ncbi:MAG TPA: TIGR03557 family F420-dependent LLM class oxidoreductase, partial [Acidimicrobiia bacterium]|nr:TIGR03557 family F420-dependent LLM class oxidoreductase [Acidimicrobiia bacterium]
MVSFGYTVMGEQAGPKQLVADAQRAEAAGFDFIAASDHYFPWLSEQGHSPYTWSVLGAIAQATERIELMTYVTCPIMRYHPTVVAQKAATIQLLSDGRFTLGLGAGENLNEHVIGHGWPSVDIRHEMLSEAIQIIRSLLAGDTVTFRGDHLDAADARLWDLPPDPPPIGVAVSGPDSCQLAGELADVMIAVEPRRQLGDMFDAAGGAGKPRIGQVGLSYDADADQARKRSLEQFRWFTGGWKTMAELPTHKHFAAASQAVREEDVAKQIPCGPDLDAHVNAVKKFVDAGFTHVAVVQIGGEHQDAFFPWAEREL